MARRDTGDAAMRRGRIAGLMLGSLVIAYFVGCGLLRFHNVHNRTFDLAFYTRMAWGLVRADFWMPITDSHVAGLHLSPVLFPIGALGALFGVANTLLVAQGLSAFGAACICGRVATRHLQSPFAFAFGVLVFVLHPNLGHVLSYEAHPGTLAILPLAWLADRLDADDEWGVFYATLGVLICREDLALLTTVAGALLMLRRRWRGALAVLLVSLAWLALFVLVLHPRFAPENGSFALHFGEWGETPGQVLRSWLERPTTLMQHVLGGRRGSYLLRVLAPLLFLPLFAPRLLLIAAPVLAMNLLSHFHTTANLDSHYLTPALPALAVATCVAFASIGPKHRLAFAVATLTMSSLGFATVGYWPGKEVARDARTEAALAILEVVHDDESVSAPAALLPHVAERERLHRQPPPDHGDSLTIIDAHHRERYARRGTLLRTLEEPVLRDLLNRADTGLVAHEGTFLAFRRGADPRDSPHILATDTSLVEGATPLCSCLGVLGGRRDGDDVVLEFVAYEPCPADLALRIRGRRVDLLFEGELGPSHLRRGDHLRSRHEDLQLEDLWIGAIRSSGAPPTPEDPLRVHVPDLD